MKMTKVDALNVALSALTADSYDVQYDATFADGTPTVHTETYTQQEVREIIEKMIEQLSKPRKPMSDEAKAAQSNARKAKTAAARAEMVAQVAPILRKYLTADMTAKELFAVAQSELPADFSAPKVQNILLREMAVEVIKTQHKGKACTYRLI